MLAAHGLDVSNYPTVLPEELSLREWDVLYVLNPAPKLLNRYGRLQDIPGSVDAEVIRYVWKGESTEKRSEVFNEFFPFGEARRLLGDLKKERETKPLYKSSGKIDFRPIVEKAGPDRVFFTADTHFSDPRMLYHRGKHFDSLESMNRTLIENWNAVVPKDGIVFHLGDFGCGADLAGIAGKLNGRKYVISGNHDFAETFLSKEMQHEARCIPIGREQTIFSGNRRIFLCHYPFLCYEGEYSGTIQLFGHVHSGMEGASEGFDFPRLQYLLPFQYDVGVDNNGFRPVSLREILGKFPHEQGPRIVPGEMTEGRIGEVQAIAEEALKDDGSGGKPPLWTDTDFSSETLSGDIGKGRAHALCLKGEVVGYFALVPEAEMPEVPVNWKAARGPACYIRRLVRCSGFSGGVGVSLMTARREYSDIRVLVPETSGLLQERLAQHFFTRLGPVTLGDGERVIAYQRVFG